MIARLALEDGTVFTGEALGASGSRTGEVVFNTAMTGYQEIFTDPSYCGQIVTMTFPLQGNYGFNPDDFESAQPRLSGVVLREVPRRPSNHRATLTCPDFLAEHGIIGIVGIDTRALTRRIRVHGSLRGVISTEEHSDLELVEMARRASPMIGANLVREVVSDEIYQWTQPLNGEDDRDGRNVSRTPHILVIDCGIKYNILRHLVENGCKVTTVPAHVGTTQIRELVPDGLLIGNGPGDPAAVTDTTETIRDLLGELPIFGICLGYQLLALALGAKTYKLSFGHHGANLPVIDLRTGRVEITSQNHGFAVDAKSLENAGGTVTHVNLNDDTLEGFVHENLNIIAVQYHPEAGPGPHDACHMFNRFAEMVRVKHTQAV